MSRLLILVFAILVSAALPSQDIQAKGSGISFTPDSGAVGTTIELSSGGWPANTEVRLFAAFSNTFSGATSFPPPSAYAGPIVVTTSDASGKWSASWSLEGGSDVGFADQPGFVYFRAKSDQPPYSAAAPITFIYSADGRRPDRSGEIHLSISVVDGMPPQLGIWGWRRAGALDFIASSELMPLPIETTIRNLSDGEYEIVAVSSDGLEAIGPGVVDIGEKVICRGAGCRVGGRILRVHVAQTVSIRDAQVVDVPLVLGRPAAQTIIDNEHSSGVQSAPTVGRGAEQTAGLIVAASVLITLLIAGGYMLTRRR